MFKSKLSKTFVWILMGLLILGLGGFGITNLGGTVRTVGTVGDKDIDVDAYAREIQEEMRAIEAQSGQSFTFEQLQSFGMDRAVLDRLITQRALDHETDRLGISLGDENLREQILNISAFQGLDGSFDRESYRFAIQQAGLSESEFENSLREDSARSLLQSAILSGTTMPETYIDTLLTYLAERRDFTWTRLAPEDLQTAVLAPTEAEIKAHYEAEIDSFTRPAAKDITYAWLSPDMILDDVEVSEDVVRALYEDREAQFNRPERRLTERLVFGSMEEARAARGRLDRGEIGFDALVEERGLELSDIDLGDVSAADLGPASEAVFDAAPGSIVGPVQSDLGPALFRINGILEAQETPFEEVRDDLRTELAADRARRVVDSRIDDIDDLLAAGATLEEVARETDMQLGQIAWHEGVSDGIAAYDGFRSAAQAVQDDDFPQIERLDDGSIFALRLDAERAATPIPLEDIRDEVAADWKESETVARLTEQATDIANQLSEVSGFTEQGLTAREEKDLTRNDFVPDTPERFLEEVFAMDLGEIRVIPAETSVFIARLDAIEAPDEDDPEVQSLRSNVREQTNSALAEDIFNAYATAIRNAAGVSINQTALNAVHSQFQ